VFCRMASLRCAFLLPTSIRSGLRRIAPPNMPSADFCAVVRSPRGSLSSELGTRRRPPGVSSVAFRAQLPDLRFASLMDMDFAVSGPLVRRSRLIFGSCSSTRTFAPRFLQTPPRGGSPCALLTLHLHQVGWKTFTSKLLNMPGTPLNRCAIAHPLRRCSLSASAVVADRTVRNSAPKTRKATSASPRV